MKRKVFPASGGEAFEIEDLEWMQTAAKEAINGLATVLGTSGTYRISGVVDNGTTISDGWIFHNGELLRFVGGDSHGTVSIVDEEINTGEGDWEKYATPGLGGSEEISFSSIQSIPLYYKNEADDNTKNNIDASKIRGSKGYTRDEADSYVQNSIDANYLGGSHYSNFLKKGTTVLKILSINNGEATVALMRKGEDGNYVQIANSYTLSSSESINVFGDSFGTGEIFELS